MLETKHLGNRSTFAALAFALALAVVGGGAGCGAQKQHQAIQNAGESFKMELAQLYISKDAHAAAIPLLQRIIAEDPKNVEARIMYGVVLRDSGLFPQAKRELEHCLTLAPGRADIHAALGVLFDAWHRPEDARSHHLTAVTVAPSNAAFRNNLGFSLYLAGDIDAAIKQLEAALAMDPSLTMAYNNLAFAYGRRGDFEDAERTFRATLGEAATMINMALVYDEHGRDDDAASLRERAYVLNPDLRATSQEAMQ